MRGTIRLAAGALILQVACGSSGGIDAAATDAPRTDAWDARDTGPGGDVPVTDAPVADVASGDAADVPPDTGDDAPGGCRVTDGIWSSIPVAEWSNDYKNAWAVAPGTFLY